MQKEFAISRKFLFVAALCLIEGFFLPMHVGFLFGLVPLSRPYDIGYLTAAFVAELMPMVAVRFLTPTPKQPGLYWISFVHATIHILQTVDVIIRGPPDLTAVPPSLVVLVIAHMYVFYDTIMHFVITYRLLTITHYYVVLASFAFWLAVFRNVPHEVFLAFAH